MPPDASPGTPLDWVRHAQSDLAVAARPRDSIILCETLCYHAQQAVEKSMKGVLLHHGVEFPYTHNISRLITVVQEAGIPWPGELDEAAELTEYAVQLRYPGMSRRVTEEDLDRAVAVAERVLAWAEDRISHPA